MSNEINSFVQIFTNKLIDLSGELDISPNNAFPRAFSELLSADIDPDLNFFDRNDAGIDFYYGEQGTYEIFQFKMREIQNDVLEWDYNAGPDGIDDIQKSFDFLFQNLNLQNVDSKIESLKEEISVRLTNINEPSSENLSILFNLVCFSKDVQPETQSKIDHFQETINDFCRNIDKLDINFRLWTVDQIKELYYELSFDNRVPTVSEMELEIVDGQEFNSPNSDTLMNQEKIIIMYVKARNLVSTFKLEGFKLFDSNVRYNIKRSAINRKIVATASTVKGMKNFHILNNGITIIADSHKGIRGNKITLVKPSIINGCQTVVSLSDALKDIQSDINKADIFEKNCFVLAKILFKPKLSYEINDIVISSNSQNIMNQRNLKSNTLEQRNFEREFSDHGWLYERKDGASDAIKIDRKSSLGITHTKYKNSSNKLRTISNEFIASSWLTFLGFPKEGQNSKNSYFKDKSDSGIYEYIFKRTPKEHAYQNNNTINTLNEQLFENGFPDSRWFLMSGLLFKFLDYVRPTIQHVRAKTKEQFPSINDADIIVKIFETKKLYQLYAIGSGQYLFASLCFYALRSLLGNNWMKLKGFNFIKNNGVIKELYNEDKINLEKRSSQIFEFEFEKIKDDPFLIIILFTSHVFNITLGEFFDEWSSADRKNRLFQNEPFKKRCIEIMDINIDNLMLNSSTTWWKSEKTLKDYFKDII